MAFGEGSFRSRAASLLRPSTFPTTQSLSQRENQGNGSGIARNTPADSSLNEKTIVAEGKLNLEQSQTLSSDGKMHHTSGSNAVANDRAAQRIVRTIPSESGAWSAKSEDLLPSVTSGYALTGLSTQAGYIHSTRRTRMYSRQPIIYLTLLLVL